jgi:hypothetical protein
MREVEVQRMLARYEGGHPTVRGFFRGWQEGETCILCGVDGEDYLRSTARAAQREPGVST